MNGSRSTPNRHGERSSLDALNRTIEGLEARIEGLMSGTPKAKPQPPAPDQVEARRTQDRRSTAAPQRAATAYADDPLAEIRERQRMLGAARERNAQPNPPQTRASESIRAAIRPPEAHRPLERPLAERPLAERPVAERRPARPEVADYLSPRQPAASYAAQTSGRDFSGRDYARREAPARQAAPARADDSMREIAEALVNLRHELKQDIADGVSREMDTLKSEIRSIRSIAEDQRLTEDLRGDFARLADSIGQIGYANSPDIADLRAEFEALRGVMDGLAREDSMQRMESRWQGLEERMQDLDSQDLRDELVQLAYRIDDIKGQLGAMSDNPVVRALEQKLMNVASAMEQLGSRMQPADAAFSEQFATLDGRLDEISRAIAASSRASAAATLDNAFLQRLDGRIVGLAEQIDAMSNAAAYQTDPSEALSARIEALTTRIEELTDEQAAMRLEERLDQLSQILAQAQKPAQQAELSGYLADISRKIDNLEHGSVNDVLAERLDYLARRIEEIEIHPAAQQAPDNGAFERLEDRLSDIAARLDEAAVAPRSDEGALRSLEDQIAHLSSLISQEQSGGAMPAGFDNRMAAIESYMATNDEYIIEAARQAAEAVVEAYSRNVGPGAPVASADMAALAGLADDLRHLEELTRGTEERTHRTFEALHGTLVQIADRLDTMEDRFAAPQPEPVYREESFGRREAAPARGGAQQMAAQPAARKVQMPVAAQLSEDALHEMAVAEVEEAYAAEAAAQALAEDVADVDVIDPPATAREGKKAAKPSLLAGLSKRFRPGGKTDASEEPTGRTVIDPTPPIDAVDMLPAGREHDLLEPGSGAPDVKKILERVRASQAAGDFDGEKAGKSDRADYIAAARRAAKAAAQETDPSQPNALKSTRAAALASSSLTPAANKGIGAKLAQHRRPILMAVGAVLLVLMAMPLVKNFAGGNRAADPAPISAPAVPDAPAQIAPQNAAPQNPAPLGQTTAPDAATNQAAATDTSNDSLTQAPAAPQSGAMADAPMDGAPVDSLPAAPVTQGATGGHLTDPRPADGMASAIQPADTVRSQDNGFANAARTQSADPIRVPAGIAPKSLADAAAAGDPNALFEIGAKFTDGRGVKADPGEAAKWYKLAADRGLAPAQYRYANLLEKGTGIERNLGQAMTYYRQAAEAGNASAMHNLAVLYASGASGQPDYTQAVNWFGKAADLGVADSQFNLAILFARGNGVKQNLEESYKWFAIAAKDGDKDAAQKRDEVANAMRKDQLENARARVDNWTVKQADPKANSVNLPDEWASGKALTTASVDMEKAVRNIQAILNKNGYDAGTPDGKLGARTVSAIKAFQTKVGQEPTGKINDALVKELLARNK
ncbi:peptidoglycan-binding protein [Neorhizobium alkalisoli]|uniref:Localization factor PodJL n=1 Tax=Neorhizobium alkalisoli TaxID=528178 RepID=A0A561QSA0_9HYPH|nr:peptidoglycan-binding protein [Neorhizobium alkalisoli]TWF53209.1 localization factor PodJL [Neorhizobium alkalisoli]